MTRKQISTLLLATAVLLIGLSQYAALSSKPGTEQTAPRDRAQLIRQYLIFNDTPGLEFDLLDRHLEGLWEQAPSVPLGEAIALIYALEGEREKAEKIVAEMGDDYQPARLYYALGYVPEMPDRFEAETKDWVNAKIETLAYKRSGDYQKYAAMLVQLRHHEQRVRQIQKVLGYFNLLFLLGLGLLIGMLFSRKYWQTKGIAYFKLTPLGFPLERLFHFTGTFMVGFIIVGFVLELVLSGQPLWVVIILTYFFQIGLAVLLVKYLLFHQEEPGILETLGFKNLRMRFFNLLQILGGLAISVACRQFAMELSQFTHWPDEASEILQQYQEIMKNPLAGGLFMMVACVVAPIFEELLFRGLLFRGLLANTKPWIALCGSSLLFAVFHPLPQWPQVFAIGFGLAVIYYRTGNILVNIWTHALWNCLVFLITYMDIAV